MDKPSAKTEQPSPKKSPTSSVGSLSLIAAIGAVCIAAASGFATYQIWQQQVVMQSQVVTSSHTLRAIDALNLELAQSKQRQQARMAQLQSQLNHLQLHSEADNASWMLAEVEYLVKLANYNLLYDANVEVAKSILQVADRRIQDVPHESFTAVRSAIAKELVQLDTLPKVDQEGLVLRLEALSRLVETLPITDHRLASSAPASSAASSPPPSQWKAKLNQSWSSIKNAVVIRHLDQPLKPMLAPEQHANLIENIQFQLSLASWAVLHRDAKLYQHALTQASTWVKNYMKQTESTQGLLTALQQLQAIDVAPNTPTLEAVLVAVKQAIGHRVQQKPQGAPAAPATTPRLLPRDEQPQVLSS